MKRLFFSCLVGLVAVGGMSRLVEAEHPEFLRHYKIVPRLSTLSVTGGFGGIHELYRLSGEYDLHTGFHHDIRDTTGGSFASFVNAEVWGSIISDHPTVAIVFDIDERLNLEGLKGEALPVAAPFDVYKFTGETSDGSNLTLFAALIGPWMYVRGGSMPPEGGADFFDYHLRMVAHTRPFADFNGDGIVDAADYTALRDSQGDAAASTALDGAGYADWQSQFGQQPPDFDAIDAMIGAALGSAASSIAIPEPSTFVLALLGALIFAWRPNFLRGLPPTHTLSR